VVYDLEFLNERAAAFFLDSFRLDEKVKAALTP
jgi:hypothetical protein